MKQTLLALVVMAGSALAQNPGYDPSAGGYPPQGAYLGQAQGAYPGQAQGGYPGQDPYAGNAPLSGDYGVPPAGYGAPVGAYAAPAPCGPGYVWIDGYADANGYFVNGYCAVPPYSGAFWIAPTFVGGRFVAGYWGRGGVGYGPGFGVRGGYVGGTHFEGGGYSNGFRAPVAASPALHAPAAAPSFRAPAVAASNFHAQGSVQGGFHAGGSAMRGGGASRGGGRR